MTTNYEGCRISAANMSTMAHRVIGDLAVLGREPSLGEVRSAVARVLMTPETFNESRAIKQQVAAVAHGYFRYHLPDQSWIFSGQQLALGTGIVDLMWTDSAGRILIDELKVLVQTPPTLPIAHRDQLERYRAAAAERYGSELVGVRYLVLPDPRTSFILRADGRYTPTLPLEEAGAQ